MALQIIRGKSKKESFPFKHKLLKGHISESPSLCLASFIYVYEKQMDPNYIHVPNPDGLVLLTAMVKPN